MTREGAARPRGTAPARACRTQTPHTAPSRPRARTARHPAGNTPARRYTLASTHPPCQHGRRLRHPATRIHPHIRPPKPPPVSTLTLSDAPHGDTPSRPRSRPVSTPAGPENRASRIHPHIRPPTRRRTVTNRRPASQQADAPRTGRQPARHTTRTHPSASPHTQTPHPAAPTVNAPSRRQAASPVPPAAPAVRRNGPRWVPGRPWHAGCGRRARRRARPARRRRPCRATAAPAP